MSSEAVVMRELSPEIAQITMQDRESKNSLTEDLFSGLAAAFKQVQAGRRYRVAVITGYDTYFCSGGTKDLLLTLHAGSARFTDLHIFTAALDCEIPVIAAMQGHGLGGGFVFGMYADFVVMSRESVYTANFMKYGFTPGIGATYILPQKLGACLATEMLVSARTYHGSDLERRGVPFPVLPRTEVLAYAQELARDVASKPRESLIALKSHLVADTRARLPGVLEKEVQMHERTFHQPEVKQRIQASLGE